MASLGLVVALCGVILSGALEAQTQCPFTPSQGANNSLCASTAYVDRSAPLVSTIREPAFGASITITSSDYEVGISTATSAVTAVLPSASAWSAAHTTGLPLIISDRTGNGAAHNITFTLNGGDTFRGGVSPKVNVNFGLLKLRPAGSPVSGWYVIGR